MPNVTPSTHSTTEAAIEFTRDLASRGFWGNVTFKFQHGDVVHITREESIPADKLIVPNTRRTHDAQHQ